MPTFTFTSPDGKNYSVQGPDGATPEQAFAILQKQVGVTQQTPQAAQVNPAVDFARSIPRGVVSGFTGALSNIGKAGAIDAEMSGVPTANPDTMPTGPQGVAQIEAATGPLPQPQGRAGKIGAAVGEALGNPASYIGPGGLPLKVAGAVLSGAGGEAARQAAEGTPYEVPAQFFGAAAGGTAAVKTLGARAPMAAIPTRTELAREAVTGYKSARNSGLEIKPEAFSKVGSQIERDLSGPDYGFTPEGAPRTFATLNKMQGAAPAAPDMGMASALGEAFGQPADYFAGLQQGEDAGRRIITAANLDTTRKVLQRIAKQTQPGPGGAPQATEDAAAAKEVLDRYKNYLSNVPQADVMAGDPEAYSRAIQTANGNYAAAKRVQGIETRIGNAEENAAGQISGSLDQQLRGQMRQLLKSKDIRGYTPEEIAQARLTNRGTLGSNTLTQLGRGGAGVIPLMTQAIAAIPNAAMTGGVGLIPQALIAGSLYGARRAGQAITASRAQKLADMLAKRSPLYESRVSTLPMADTASNKAAIVRALIGATQ